MQFYDFLNRHYLEVAIKLRADGFGSDVLVHGDKCLKYKKFWEKNNIPFYIGSILFILSYSRPFSEQAMGNRPIWVIDAYNKYKIELAYLLVELKN